MDLIDEEYVMWLERCQDRNNIGRLRNRIAGDDMEMLIVDIGDDMSESRLAIATRSAQEDMSESMITLVCTLDSFL